MKIQIASDLHLEFGNRAAPAAHSFRTVPDRDVLVLAGDIGRQRMARFFVERELETSPVLYVPGNHEYYSGRSRTSIDAGWRTLAAEHPGLHYLVAEGAEIDGVRFWGAPWYSDLWGSTDPRDLETVQTGINDFSAWFNGGGEWNVPRHINCHLAQTDLLAAQAGQVDVVITHWPPTKGAIHPRFEGDMLNPYFINDREDLVRTVGATLWISGHTHEAFDYRVGTTRVVGNPTGYPDERRVSRLFRPDRTVEVNP